MDEGLELDIGHEGVNFGYLFKRELAREHGAACAHIAPELYGVLVCNVGLGGDMHGKVWGGLSARREHAGVGDERRVGARFLQKGKIILHAGKVFVSGVNIYCDVHLFAARVRVFRRLFQLLARKVIGKGAQ